MMNQQETLYAIALAQVSRLKDQDRNHLLDVFGSAKEVYEHRTHLRDAIPEASDALISTLGEMDLWLKRAEEELAFMEKGGIVPLLRTAEDYPQRLLQCEDSPSLLYYRGNAPLNVRHVLSIVGTRQITAYGKDLCAQFVKDLRTLCPDIIVVSGLAYGVDIHAHRAALENGLPTVGVLAHGLEQIYPTMHRDTAVQMVHQGGLLTEYISCTNMDRRLFVQRNRIVAGMADAVLVVESAAKGGSLITASLAGDYNREVFAFPGRITDTYSAGCNKLIRLQQAQSIESAAQFVEAMGWETNADRQRQATEGVQQELFPELTLEQQKIMDTLLPVEGTPINVLAIKTGIPIQTLTTLLFSLEMIGLVKRMGGNSYRK